MSRWRRPTSRCASRLGAALLLAALLLHSAPASTAPLQPVSRPDTDLLILAVRLDRTVLADAMTVWASPGGCRVPLGGLADLLNLAIAVDPEHGTARGFVITEKRHFALDLAAGTVSAGGAERRFDPRDVELHEDDIYVETSLLAQWLPLDLELDPSAATLTVLPREPLPMQLRLERQQRIESTLAGRDALDTGFPRVDNPYRLFDGPALDQTLFVSSTPDSSRRRVQHASWTTYASTNLLFLETNLYLRGDDVKPLDEYRLSVGRQDPDARLLGPLRARQVQFGETWHPGLDLVSRPLSGPGAVISNFPLTRPARFDRHSFRGDLPPGWEVEIYRNDALIGWQESGADGTYDFEEVPLLFGLNTFRLAFYGPQGQHREERRTFNVGESMTPPGRFHYRLAGSHPEHAEPRVSAEFDLGLARCLSTSLSLASVGMADGQHQYGRVGSRLFWKWFFADAGLAVDQDRRTAGQAALSARAGLVGLSLQHTVLNGFQSETFQSSAGALQSRSVVKLDARLRTGFLPTLVTSAEARRDRLLAGHWIDQYSGRLSSRWLGVSFTNQARWTQDRKPGRATETQAEGTFLASRNWRRLGVRGEIDYGLPPDRGLRTVVLSAEGRLGLESFIGFQVERRPASNQTRQFLSLGRNGGAFSYGINTSYSAREGVGGNLSFSIGLSRDSRSGRWYTQARSAASSGAASARVFLDSNGNGVMDAGEEPIAGVGLSLNQGGQPAETGPDGIAFLRNMPSHEEVAVALSSNTLSDPLWIPGRTGVRIVPRPGSVPRIDFPVIESGEITGTLYRGQGRRRREAPGVRLELVDMLLDSVIAVTRSAYDGFYDFSGVRPGRYAIRVAAREGERLQVTVPTAVPVEIAPGGAVIDGIDIFLQAPKSETTAKVAPKKKGGKSKSGGGKAVGSKVAAGKNGKAKAGGKAVASKTAAAKGGKAKAGGKAVASKTAAAKGGKAKAGGTLAARQAR